MDSIVYGFDSDEEIKDNILDFKILEDLKKKGTEPQNYLDGWICFCLFIRDIEKNKLNDEQSKEYLIQNLIID